MYRRANRNGLLIACDRPCGILRVATDTPETPGQRRIVRRLAAYDTEAAWHASDYARQVGYDDVVMEIEQFWRDIRATRTSAVT